MILTYIYVILCTFEVQYTSLTKCTVVNISTMIVCKLNTAGIVQYKYIYIYRYFRCTCVSVWNCSWNKS